MSMIQSIIGSAAGASAPVLTYPIPGSNYPSGAGTYTSTEGIAIVGGHYNWPSFINTNPVNGLWRRTYTGMALDGTNIDSNFPSSYTQVRSELDDAVGFGFALDSATNYTMEWLGYFVPDSDGNFTFGVNGVDDYFMMWIGNVAVSGFDSTNYLFKGNGGSAYSPVANLLSGRWYPVRLVYTEGGGANNCSIVSGLDGQTLSNNNAADRAGHFKTDDSTNAGSFPSGLIYP
jgi:hypothetical protein